MMREADMYTEYELQIVQFSEADNLVTTLSGDEDGSGGTPGKSDW